MKSGESPVDYREVPEQQLRTGRAVQHDGSNESALAIVGWLQAEEIDSWASPKTRNHPALIRIPRFFGPDNLIGPDDWVFLEPGGGVSIHSNGDFNTRFVHADATEVTPIYKSYNALFKSDLNN